MSNAMLVTSNGFTEEVSEQVDEDVELDSDDESETMAIDSYEPTPSMVRFTAYWLTYLFLFVTTSWPSRFDSLI